ncbi:uncharacterized protein LOC124927646 isoform X2 [Impatiens glandulifera]|uniref:uncharacterized protein LOC124927646 isoform X2 n=1 Tax=Impatiens glandulifera TaxID=253017 RepID=UPI001FB0BFE6|nr:uncharacterized protein LOC124927646 isoform X2 [Impatiens glandulifera]
MDKQQLSKIDQPDEKTDVVSPQLTKVAECPQLKKPIKAHCDQIEEKDVVMDMDGSRGNISAVSGELVANNYKSAVAEEKDAAMHLDGSKDKETTMESETILKSQDLPQVGKLSMDLGDCRMRKCDLLETSDPDSDVQVKRAKLSHPENVKVGDQLQSSSKDGAAKSNSSISSLDPVKPYMELIGQAGGTCMVDYDKLAIYPRDPNLKFPDDGSFTILPFDNDMWVMVGVNEKK